MKNQALKDIVPIGEFRSNLADWVKRVGDTRRPVVLTQRGRAAAVVVSPDEFDELLEERAVVRAILSGLQEASAGHVVDDADVWAEMDGLLDE
jgi:prevent-host-death family protein